jgi:hypothetical protein
MREGQPAARCDHEGRLGVMREGWPQDVATRAGRPWDVAMSWPLDVTMTVGRTCDVSMRADRPWAIAMRPDRPWDRVFWRQAAMRCGQKGSPRDAAISLDGASIHIYCRSQALDTTVTDSMARHHNPQVMSEIVVTAWIDYQYLKSSARHWW